MGQVRSPQIGYCFPAGGQRGTTFQMTLGGQSLRRPSGVSVTGQGVRVKVLDYTGSIRFFNPHDHY